MSPKDISIYMEVDRLRKMQAHLIKYIRELQAENAVLKDRCNRFVEQERGAKSDLP